jgi:hypothetical protein
MPDTYGRHPRMPSIGQGTNHALSHSNTNPPGLRYRLGHGMFDQDPEQPARIDYAALERGGSQPVKLTVTAQWALVGWIGGQWQLSIAGYRAFVTDRGDAGNGHAWEWQLYGNDDHNYWNGWVDSADEGKAAAETTIQVDAS